MRFGVEGGVFKVLMIPTLVVETVISQNFVLTQVSNFIANFVLKTDRQTVISSIYGSILRAFFWPILF